MVVICPVLLQVREFGFEHLSSELGDHRPPTRS
jgi:hypothetical protein